jgi:type II secretory ATPase GspE/PulE/Tfp pilus assembly ATPase PilB-like protein
MSMAPDRTTPFADIPALAEGVIKAALERGASDVHLEPTSGGYEARFRVDGILETAERYSPEIGRAMVGRLMVMARLLTYRVDIPQEGRVTLQWEGQALEGRLAVIPTTHGLRAALRLPAELIQPKTLAELDLPEAVADGLRQFAGAEAGLLLVCGPAGSGKTTTLYALMEQMARERPGTSLISLEDPVERDLAGVTQVEVSPFGQLTYEKALRSILRQDPQVLMLGEIRDRATASLALQAALSGHRLLCTMHAGDPAGGIARLGEMGLEPYQITSALFGVAAQRLLRRREGNGYRGRVPAGEWAGMSDALRRAVLDGADAPKLRTLIRERPGHVTLRASAEMLVEKGVTDGGEVERVLGTTLS